MASELLEALEAPRGSTALLELLRRHTSRGDPYSFPDALASVPRSHLPRLCSSLASLASLHTEAIYEAVAPLESPEEEDEPMADAAADEDEPMADVIDAGEGAPQRRRRQGQGAEQGQEQAKGKEKRKETGKGQEQEKAAKEMATSAGCLLAVALLCENLISEAGRGAGNAPGKGQGAKGGDGKAGAPKGAVAGKKAAATSAVLMGAPLLDLLTSAQCLHSLLMLEGVANPLQDAASRLCETWWSLDLPEKETLVAQALPYLLYRTLATGAPGDVRRLFGMRHAFPLLDYEDPSIGDTRKLLLRAFISPGILKVDEGKKFLALAMTLDLQLLREAIIVVRNQIPSRDDSFLTAYAGECSTRNNEQ